ncbi:MAG: hypothetical protein WC676_03715 [Candidatus Omnitrophota bacterium]
MSEEKKDNQQSGSDCCSSSSCGCCCGKKLLVGFVIGVLLTIAAFGAFSAGQCMTMKGKVCPMTPASMQK